jgi:transmembrane sensor
LRAAIRRTNNRAQYVVRIRLSIEACKCPEGGAGNPVIELDPLKREAVSWIERLTSGQATEDDAASFRHWRRQSQAHEAAFLAARRLWDDVGPAGANLRQRGEALPRVSALQEVPSRRAVSRRWLVGGGALAAASVATLAIVDPPLGLWPSWRELAADYRTRTGEQRDVALRNDLSLRMNTQTSISIRSLDADAGRLRLIAGELSLAMAPNTSHSFSITAADGEVRASGARFSVRYVPEDAETVCVTCLDGKVRVNQRAAAAEIGPRQQVSYGRNGLGDIVTIDPDVASAWQQGVVIFRAMPLVQVVEEINRYRPGRVILLDAKLGQSPVSGRFEIAHIGEVLTRIQLAFGVKMRSLPAGIVLLG